MSVIEIEHPHSLGRDGCIAAVDAVARDLERRYGLSGMAWNGDTLGFSGHGVEGSLEACDDRARVRLVLHGMASLMRPVIEAEIRRKLDQHLG